jgi:chromate reductase, NAD(P)H dehydrogenase (quinone)
MTPPVRVVGIAGSLRAASYNGWLLRAAVECAPPELSIAPFAGLAEIPLYNQDVEAQGDPVSVASLRGAVHQADGLLIASPEFNYGIPGVLKNAIDWISRPPGRSPLQKKPVAIMGASTGPSGTMRMQPQLRLSFQALDAYAMPKPEVVIPFCKDKFDAEGRLTDEKTREHLKGFLAAFAVWIRRF